VAAVGNDASPAGARALVRALHRALRDTAGQSSLVERFEELTKVLYCRLTDRDGAVFGEGAGGLPGRIRRHFRARVQARRGLFPVGYRTIRLTDTALAHVGEVLARSKAGATDRDLAGHAYEELVRHTFEKGDHQQFFTPPEIVSFVVEMVRPALRGRVLDPASGTGGFLTEVARRCPRAALTLHAIEIDPRLAWVTGLNLELTGSRGFEVACLGGAGTLGKGVRDRFGAFDVILTNPPFGSDLSQKAALRALELGRGHGARRRGVLFLERCLDLLTPGGTLAIILDDGVLNAAGNQDARALLLERADVQAVVSLPTTTFMPYASVKASVVVARKRRDGARRGRASCYFGAADTVGKKPNGEPRFRLDPATGQLALDSDLPAVLAGWRRKEDRGFRVEIPGPRDVGFTADGLRLDLAYHHPARCGAAATLVRSRHPCLTLGEICGLRRESVTPARACPNDEIVFLGLKDIEAGTGACAPGVVHGATLTTAARRFHPGDILYARLRPELRKVALVSGPPGGGLASAECLVLTPRARTDGAWVLHHELLAAMLRSDLAYGQIVHLVTGIGRPRIHQRAVLAMRLPVPSSAAQARMLARYRGGVAAAAKLDRQCAQAAGRAAVTRQAAVDRLTADLLG